MIDGFEDVVHLLSPDSSPSLQDAITLWKAARRFQGVILESGSSDGLSTAILAAARKDGYVISTSSTGNLSEDAEQFLLNHGIRSNVEFHSCDIAETPLPDNAALILLWCESDEWTFRRTILFTCQGRERLDGRAPLIIFQGAGKIDPSIVIVIDQLLAYPSFSLVSRSSTQIVVQQSGTLPVSAYLSVACHLKEAQAFAAATEVFELALDAHSENAECWHEYARSLIAEGKIEEAEKAARRTVELSSNHHSLNTVGMTLLRQGKGREALEVLKQALDEKPDYLHAINSLGWAYEETGELELAELMFRRCVELDPQYVHGQYNLGRVCLALGKLKEGWERYEWRWQLGGFPSVKRSYPFDRWNGQPLDGKKIVIWAEQGIGDQIAFAGMIRDIARMGAGGAIECSPKLVSLFARSFPEFEVVPFVRGQPPHQAIRDQDFDYEVPLASLGRGVRSSSNSFPIKASYLVPDVRKVEHWQQTLDALSDKPKIGIAWKSRNTTGARRKLYLSIEELLPVLQLDAYTFVCVQYGDVRLEIEEARCRFGVDIKVLEDLDLFDDVDSTIAMTACLNGGVSPLLSSCADVMAVNDIPVFAFARQRTERSLGSCHSPWFPHVKAFAAEPDESPSTAVVAIANALQQSVPSTG